MASLLSYAQAIGSMLSLLKIKEMFSTLPDTKLIEVHGALFFKPTNKKRKKIQYTTKGLFRKQAIVSLSKRHIDKIIKDVNMHVFYINNTLKNIKSLLRVEFIYACARGISINTNNVPTPSDLITIERYLKSIDGINNNEVFPPCLPQSKSYLKIIGISYIQLTGNNTTSEEVTNFLSYQELFEFITLASKPRIIKASPKSDIAIIWIDIWDSQNRSKAKLLINYFFNFSRHIATIKVTNMNPGVSQYHNCWKWGYLTFSCKVHRSKCQKCNGSHKLENYKDMAWCCKVNHKINPPRLETKASKPCPHEFKCANCKGNHMTDNNKCPFWRY